MNAVLRRRWWIVVLCVLTVALTAAPGWAQGGGDDDDDIETGGVYIDPDGMVRHRDRDLTAAARAAHLRQVRHRDQAQTGYVSLPRAFAEAKRLIDAGEPLPDELRYLGGLTRIEHVFVYPDEGDLVIAGPVEPIVHANARRPIGGHTGRPVLHLEDMVVALRLAGPGARGGAFGCSIDMPAGAQDAVNKVMAEQRRGGRDERMAELAAAVGPQTVRVFRVADDTRFAATCVEADYALKRLAIGLDRTPVPGVQYAVGRGGAQFTRWWFTAADEPIVAASADGLAFALTGPSLRLTTSPEASSRGSNPAAESYAERFSAALPKFAAAMPELADLWNLSDLALVAALIRVERLHEKARWDVAWLTDASSGGFPVARVTVPRTAQTVVDFRGGAYAIGGVSLRHDELVGEGRYKADGAAPERVERPAEGWLHVE